MKTRMRAITDLLLAGLLLTAGVLTLAGAAYGAEPIDVTVVRWPYT